MRLDARIQAVSGWWVYDAEACVVLRDVVWVDDEDNQYAVLANDLRPLPGDTYWPTRIHRARKIAIYPARKLVIINPIEDADDAQITDVVGREVAPA